ncbi:MAG: glycosyltransferase family 39 protein [Candidatus Omnitrophota bacterium]
MFFILWTMTFLLGCVAQSFILAQYFVPGLLLYGFAGTLSYLLLSFPRGETSSIGEENGSNDKIAKDLDGLAFVLGLISLFVCLWLVHSGSKTTFPPSPRLGYALHFWLGFLVLTLFSVRRPLMAGFRLETKQSLLPLAGLLLFSLCLGVYRLTSVPYTIHGDEGMVGLYARTIVAGNIETLFSTSWYAIPQFFFFPPACGLYLFGDSLFGLRMSAVIIGTLSVIPFYLLTRSWWGWKPAFFGGLLLIGNHWFLHLMHSGVNYVQASFFAMLLLCLNVFAHRRRSLGLYVLSGLVIGLALQSYQANHILPFLWLATQIWLFFLRKIRWRWFAISTAAPLVVAALTISPLWIHDIVKSGKTEMFSSRAEGVAAWTPSGQRHLNGAYRTNGDSTQLWREQFSRALLAPIYYPDTSMQYGGKSPFLDRIASVFFIFAFFIMARRFYDERWSLPFGWIFGVLLAGGALTVDAPFYPRLAGLSAILFLPIAGLFASVMSTGKREDETQPAAILFLLVSILLANGLNWHQYFHIYAQDVNLQNIHYPQTRMAYFILEKGPQTNCFVFSGGNCQFNSGTVRFAAKGCRGQDMEAIPPGFGPGTVAVIVEEPRLDLLPAIKEKMQGAKIEEFFSPLTGARLFTTLYRE